MAFSNPVTTPQSGSRYIDALSWGSHWQDPGAGTRLAIWVAGSAGVDENWDFGGQTFTGNNAPEENAAFAAAFQTIANVCNITFVAATSQANADIIVGTVGSVDAGTSLGTSVPPGEDVGPLANQQGGVAINWSAYATNNFSSLKQGGYDFVTYIHEIGHALGLKHPHDVLNGNPTFPGVPNGAAFDDLGDFNLNQGLYTMMSYNDGWQTRPGGPLLDTGQVRYGYEGTPMALDIAALQYLYGANTSYRTGDDAYVLASANRAGTFYSCLWDAGGDDTIRNDSSKASTLDLRAATLARADGGGGYLSFVTGIDGGFTIAFGAVIENAVGGSGADRITGNGVANVLAGRGGNDTMAGGAGDDTLVGGTGNDRITGGTGGDLMQGDGGADQFIFSRTTESFARVDIINLFEQGQDKINLVAIDAIAATTAVNEVFGFIGTALFGTAAGSLRYEQDTELGATLIEAETTGDGVADFLLVLNGLYTLTAADFLR